MKLTADQMFEICNAISCGLKEASLAAMSAAEKKKWLAEVRANAARYAATSQERPEVLQHILESAELADQPLVLSERSRAAYHARPAKQRGTLAGHKMGLNDMLTGVPHYSAAQRQAVNARLAVRDLPSLTQLMVALRGSHARILKRGKIRTEEEYYMVQEILADVSLEIPASDRDRFEQLAASFEGRTPAR